MAGVQKISKRAAHKLAVAARKKAPIVKRRKQRRNALPFPSDFFTIARETEREGVLLTKVCKKPPTFRAESLDDQGNLITTALQKDPRPLRGYTVMLPGGIGHRFPTLRKACKFVGLLQATEATEDEATEATEDEATDG